MSVKTVGKHRFPFHMTVRGGYEKLHDPICDEGYMSFVGVLHGRVKLRVGLHELEAGEGELFFIPASTLLLTSAVSGFASVRIMSFHRSILTENMDSLEQDLLYMLSLQARVTPLCFNEEHPLHEKLSSYLQTAEEEYLSKEPCYQLPIRSSIYQMMTALLRYYSAEKKDDEHAVYHNVMRMKAVLDRIEADHEGTLTVAELSSMLLVSPDHFTRIFKESLGVTPLEYINRVRVGRAMILLAKTSDSIDSVAKASGFSGTSYFYRLFKALVGSSPLAFKKSLE